jgi:YhcH/YjgK/YiaL family protein
MIFDSIKNRNLYVAISPRIKAALEYLTTIDFSTIETKSYELDGENLFALIQKYNTVSKEQGKLECHRNYIDIQYIAEGTEQIGVTTVDSMKVITEYNPEIDVAFLSGEGNYVTLAKSFYCIFFPQDAHQPKVALGNAPALVKKVVMKIKIS